MQTKKSKRSKRRLARRRKIYVKETICTIPVNDVLAAKDGCPICRMHDTLEEHMLEFIMGDAMMEPDVRIETNRKGFCAMHFEKMLARRNRLALALMLESRLKAVESTALGRDGLLKKPDRAAKALQAEGGCYLCERIDAELAHLFGTFFKLWKKEPEFQKLVAEQPFFCLPHYRLLLTHAQKELDKKACAAFEQTLTGVFEAGLRVLEEDVSGFCQMFDYRSIGKEWGGKKDAPERAIAFLSGYRKS